MQADAGKARGTRPFLFTDLRHGLGVDEIVDWLVQTGGLASRAAAE